MFVQKTYEILSIKFGEEQFRGFRTKTAIVRINSTIKPPLTFQALTLQRGRIHYNSSQEKKLYGVVKVAFIILTTTVL